MSNKVNTELLDRVGDLLDDDTLTNEQVHIIKTMVHNNDLEGLYWVLPKIEKDIADRQQTDLSNPENDLDGDYERDLARDNDDMPDLGADGANEARLTRF